MSDTVTAEQVLEALTMAVKTGHSGALASVLAVPGLSLQQLRVISALQPDLSIVEKMRTVLVSNKEAKE